MSLSTYLPPRTCFEKVSEGREDALYGYHPLVIPYFQFLMTTHLKHKPWKIIAQNSFKIQSQFRFLCFETGLNSIRQNSHDQSTYRRQIRSQNLKYKILTTAYQPGVFPSINVSQNHSLLNPTEGEHGKRGRFFDMSQFSLKKLQGFKDLRKNCHLFHGSHPIPDKKNHKKSTQSHMFLSTSPRTETNICAN